MLLPTVNERGGGVAVDDIQAPAEQRETGFAELLHRRSEVELAVKPRLHRVLIGRSDIGEMTRPSSERTWLAVRSASELVVVAHRGRFSKASAETTR